MSVTLVYVWSGAVVFTNSDFFLKKYQAGFSLMEIPYVLAKHANLTFCFLGPPADCSLIQKVLSMIKDDQIDSKKRNL